MGTRFFTLLSLKGVARVCGVTPLNKGGSARRGCADEYWKTDGHSPLALRASPSVKGECYPVLTR
jgi:hypothetical protein